MNKGNFCTLVSWCWLVFRNCWISKGKSLNVQKKKKNTENQLGSCIPLSFHYFSTSSFQCGTSHCLALHHLLTLFWTREPPFPVWFWSNEQSEGYIRSKINKLWHTETIIVRHKASTQWKKKMTCLNCILPKNIEAYITLHVLPGMSP